ncbi:MAG: 5-formyltetrahydrofolate cyclo-ligase, partial [Elusimicrobiota bacterium]|nr:5-formyltetrahydrofolate cyclo-ligase [Elusimicrobiota bacterium]
CLRMRKLLLREKLRNLRNSIPILTKKKLDKLIEKNVLSLEEFQKAKTVMFFVSFNSEVNTLPLIRNSLRQGKIVSVPKVVADGASKEILPVRIKNLTRELKKGYCGILEPKSIRNKLKPEKIDLVFVPALGFDTCGRRLGYGGGFYDVFLRKIPLKKRIGIAYEIQVVDKVPANESDMRVNKIITEKGVKTCQKQ